MPKTDISVRELVDKVQRGEMVLPEMQRRVYLTGDILSTMYGCAGFNQLNSARLELVLDT